MLKSIRELAIKDSQHIVESFFDLELELHTPDMTRSVVVKGKGQTNNTFFKTDGVDAVAQLSHASFHERSIIDKDPSFSIRNADGRIDIHFFLLSFRDHRGVKTMYQVKQQYPNEATGLISVDLAIYETDCK
ncbi:MAG: hypothetical protein HRU26_05045 [Psychroserpens sp.]|nr:hypothetical protein [Psychroserpens sp.]